MSKRKSIRSDIAWSTPSSITVKGFDLCQDLLGKVSLGDMAFLELTDRLPTARESAVFNSIAVTLVEHGLTPSAMATRMTYVGAPEAMQACAAQDRDKEERSLTPFLRFGMLSLCATFVNRRQMCNTGRFPAPT